MSKNKKQPLVPKLRFPEFSNEVPINFKNGNEVFEPISNKNHNSDLPILAITQEHGTVPRELIDYKVSVTEKSIASYKVVEIGDFIISLRSFQGGIEYSSYRGICSPAYIILRKKISISEFYYKHYFKTDKFIQDMNKDIEGIRDGKMVSYNQFSSLVLPVPDIKEQQKIADCLSSLDELITAEAQKLDALKVHKKGLMQKLFPAEGKTVPKLRFPEFRENPDWTKQKIRSFVEKSFYGTSRSTSDTGKYPVLRMGDMKDGKIDFSNVVYINLSETEFDKLKLKKGDLLLNRTNSFDLVGKVSLFNSDMACLTASYIVTYRLNTKKVNSIFCNFVLNTFIYQEKIRALSTKAVNQANINPTLFQDSISIMLPGLSEQQKIADCLSSLDELIAAQSEKIETLKVHKKGLMQQLFPSADEVNV